MVREKIDFIMPWVDGSDPNWLQEKARYLGKPSLNTDASIARYRDWDNLQFWFRGVEKFTPWVNKIHFVTWGHLPKWLNTEHPKLQIVKHTDFIPQEYLPVFSSRPIELNIHRIPELSDQFVLFNDDYFILKPLNTDYFFKHGLPCCTAALNVSYSPEPTQEIPMITARRIINKHFTKSTAIFANKRKWFNLKNGMPLVRTYLLAPWSFIPGIYSAHGPNAYTKKVFNTLWEKEYALLNNTCQHKFREITDVNQFLAKCWQLCEGTFEPHRDLCMSIGLTEPYSTLEKIVFNHSLVCLNDENVIDNFEEIKQKINTLLNSILPEKSSFEI